MLKAHGIQGRSGAVRTCGPNTPTNRTRVGRIGKVGRSRRRNGKLKMNFGDLKAKDEELLRSRPAVALRGVGAVGREFG